MMDQIESPTRKHWPAATIDDIINAVAEGGYLEVILASRPEYPSRTTFYRWLGSDDELKDRFNAAVAEAVGKKTYRTR
ncbi:hypothetical protein ACFQ3P_13810 [Paraburkholderia sabiae]|uniref:Uncharacterized protein n=1 Tax=Paraburkholderia sabiae TaxID=273251 RepID=A0ABU9QD59_9BURK|nr:hypothetical protein [Paraburkholderia sabiae]WJZ76175.1 hypothetical protein QEN71_10350 [Paraburkholderia sabiae]CAD6525920.1 hypothetical protein LMG24235_01898 [Paraburkholderia sabiae]